MKRFLQRVLVLAIVGGAALTGVATSQAVGPYVQPQGDLFYNYYENGSRQGGIPVQMYPAPQPVPPYVGQTYITYQPMMPHEFLYTHHRTYRRYTHGVVPANTTRVFWYRGIDWPTGRYFGFGSRL
ncbi:MAG TPA: hypothetical protein VG713_05005 [Pirellulales bacterium]|nr:hypothetical protein [Pirellulales bacterium]